MSCLIVIPARYGSSRFPGKPLALLRGANGQAMPLIQRSWLAAQQVPNIDRVVVATDDARIRETCEGFGAEVIMTSDAWGNGTERCAEAVQKIGAPFDIVINLQGDAPLTPAWFISALVDELKQTDWAVMATPVLRCDGQTLTALRNDRLAGRVGGTTAVFGADRRALYFSKEVIPFTASPYSDRAATPVFHHVGVYAYKPAALHAYGTLPIGPLETLEGLEQLRFLENGHPVLCVEVNAQDRTFWELNNPSDIPVIETMMATMGME